MPGKREVIDLDAVDETIEKVGERIAGNRIEDKGIDGEYRGRYEKHVAYVNERLGIRKNENKWHEKRATSAWDGGKEEENKEAFTCMRFVDDEFPTRGRLSGYGTSLNGSYDEIYT